MKARLVLLCALFALLAFPGAARADGIIVPLPPPCDPCPPPPCPSPICPPPSPMAQLVIRQHHVQVTVDEQVAVTRVDQVFFNPNDWTVEGTYIFPLPPEAAVSSFTLWVDGQPVQGEILDAEQARRTYQEIVSSLRDPALLEYAGRGAVQAHVFPIPAGGERRIELEYSQALTAEEGLVRYVYPLNTEKFSQQPLENVSVSVDIRSHLPIRAVYSPSHEIALDRQDDHHVQAGWEAQEVLPTTDFALYYSLGESEAFHLISYRDPHDADPDGYFLLLLAPRPDVDVQAVAKDVLLVLDRSGSMEGEKFQQAQEALRYILQRLNPEDRFNVLAFSTGVEAFSSSLQPAANAPQAVEWVNGLSAQGSTDINRALLEASALVDAERPGYLIFLTDGLPTEGVIDSQHILKNMASVSENLRLFPFGVGYDVDTFLLDSLAQAHHGSSSYVLPEERLDEKLSAFYTRISTPVLTDLELEFEGAGVYDLYPSPLPDLFAGSQIIVTGRYRQGGAVTARLTGKINQQEQTFTFSDQRLEDGAAAEGGLPAVARLWATRKIGHLLSSLRLEGADQETIDQIVRLSIRFGIVTPYTSYLVTEPMPLGEAQQSRIAAEQFDLLKEAPAASSSGQAAVELAAGQRDLVEAEAAAAPQQGAADVVRLVGARTFYWSEGAWIDTAFDPQAQQTVKVAFLSEDYFALAEAQPDLAAAFALGERVIVLSGGTAFEVVPQDSRVPAVEIPAAPVQPAQTEPPSPAALDSTAAPQPAAASDSSARPGVALPCAGGLLPVLLLALMVLLRSLWRAWG